MSPTALSPLPADWNADVITGTRAAILDYKMEATSQWKSKKKQKDPGSHECGAIKPDIHCLPRLLSKRKRSVLNKSHFGGMSFCHNSQNNAIIKF